jgi:GNAT superfamily N-acetyltransferase
MTFQIRRLSTADYPYLISVLDQWWSGRQMADKLPRLFFEHFTDTSFAAERDGQLAGFLVGFVSQSRPGEAYIHFVGVDPAERASGLGRLLYEAFFAAAQARGCVLVRDRVRFIRSLGGTLPLTTARPRRDGTGALSVAPIRAFGLLPQLVAESGAHE